MRRLGYTIPGEEATIRSHPIPLFPFVIGAILALHASPCRARELSFEDRVNAQRAIEQVYWRHRIRILGYLDRGRGSESGAIELT